MGRRELLAQLQACKRRKAWCSAVDLISKACFGAVRVSILHLNSAASMSSQWPRVLHLTQAMRDLASRNIAIAAADWALGAQLFMSIRLDGLRPDVYSYNSAARWPKALCAMDSVALNKLLTACPRWEAAMSLATWAPMCRISLNLRCLTAALATCERASAWMRAMDLTHKQKLDQKAFTTLISAAGKGFCWQQGLDVFSEMPSAMVKPDGITLCSSINACKESLAWGSALELLNGPLTRASSDPSGAYQVAMSAVRNGQWQLSLQMLQVLATEVLEFSEACRNAAISAENWRIALGLALFGRTSIGLSSAISACGHWEAAWELQRLQAQWRIEIDAWPSRSQLILVQIARRSAFLHHRFMLFARRCVDFMTLLCYIKLLIQGRDELELAALFLRWRHTVVVRHSSIGLYEGLAARGGCLWPCFHVDHWPRMAYFSRPSLWHPHEADGARPYPLECGHELVRALR